MYFSERTSTNFFNYSLSDHDEKTENVSSATFEGAYLRRYLKLGCNRIKYHRRAKSRLFQWTTMGPYIRKRKIHIVVSSRINHA